MRSWSAIHAFLLALLGVAQQVSAEPKWHEAGRNGALIARQVDRSKLAANPNPTLAVQQHARTGYIAGPGANRAMSAGEAWEFDSRDEASRINRLTQEEKRALRRQIEEARFDMDQR